MASKIEVLVWMVPLVRKDSPVLRVARPSVTWEEELPLKRLFAMTPLKVKVLEGAALAVGKDVLVAEAGVRTGAGEGVRMDARAHGSQLREGPGAERRVLDSGCVENVAVGWIGGVELGCSGDVDAGGDIAGLHFDEQSRGPVRLNEETRLIFGC